MSDIEHARSAAVAPAMIPVHRWMMAVGMLVLNLVDLYLTKAIIGLGGHESNPVMRAVVDSPSAPVVLKTVMSLGVGVLLVASPRASRLADRSFGIVLVVYTIVVGWNIGILLQAAGRH